MPGKPYSVSVASGDSGWLALKAARAIGGVFAVVEPVPAQARKLAS